MDVSSSQSKTPALASLSHPDDFGEPRESAVEAGFELIVGEHSPRIFPAAVVNQISAVLLLSGVKSQFQTIQKSRADQLLDAGMSGFLIHRCPGGGLDQG